MEPSDLKWSPLACRSRQAKLRAARPWGRRRRRQAALTTTGRAGTTGLPGPGKRDRKVHVRNQRCKASSCGTGSNPGDMGREAMHARNWATPKPVTTVGKEAMGKDCGVPMAMSQGHSWTPTLSIGPW